MRIATAAQMAELDRRATEEFGIPISRLMDAAGRRVAQAAEEILGVQGGRRVLVLAGKGNNGGGGSLAPARLHPGGFAGPGHVGTPPWDVWGGPPAARARGAAAGLSSPS